MLLRRRICLENAKRIALSVDEISVPAHTRHSKLWQGNLTAGAHDSRCNSVEILHLHRADKGVRSMLRWRRLCGTLQQTASRPFRLNPPVFNRQSFRLGESPPKDLAVKSHGAAGIVGLDFEICGCVHCLCKKADAHSLDGVHGSVRTMIILASSPLLDRRRFRQNLREQYARASQRFRYVGTDIFRAHMLLKF